MSTKPRNLDGEYRSSPKSLSKSAILKKTISQKSLKKQDSLKYIPYKSYVNKVVPVSIHSPKLTQTKSQKSLVQGCSSVKRTTLGNKEKQPVFLQRPKINKKKNNNQLQDKIKSLEMKLEKLKANFDKADERVSKSKPKSNTKSKSKSRKSSNNSKASIKKALKIPSNQEEQKNDTSQMSSSKINSLDAYVTKISPSQKTKAKKQLNIKSPKAINSAQQISSLYYLQQAIKSINQEDDHPSKEHITQSITTLNYLSNLARPSSEAIHHIKIKLKTPLKSEQTKTIVLDLDQTLIHCNDTGQVSDFKVPISFPNGEVVEAGVNIRPHAKELLKNLSKHFQVIVFTASHSCYANVVLDCLDPDQKYVSQRVFRDHCYQTEQGMFIKDLRIFSNRDLAKMVLVDNAAHSYYFQLSNGIPIIPYYFDKKDTQLKSLEKFLMEEILPAKDVRPVLTNFFKLQKYTKYNSPEELIEELYINSQK